MHAARNFALQEHAIENTESVSLLCICIHLIFFSPFVGLQFSLCLKFCEVILIKVENFMCVCVREILTEL